MIGAAGFAGAEVEGGGEVGGGPQMILRQATEADAQILFEWRNDPLSRKNSRNTEPVPWESHIHWLATSLTNPERDLLIAECDGEPVGTIRLDYSSTDCELSWTVAPDRRRQGFAKEMVSLAIRKARVATLKAEIKFDNEPSQRVARALGFIEGQHHDGLAIWNYTRKEAERPTGA